MAGLAATSASGRPLPETRFFAGDNCGESMSRRDGQRYLAVALRCCQGGRDGPATPVREKLPRANTVPLIFVACGSVSDVWTDRRRKQPA